MAESRKERRYEIPEIYRKYVVFKIKDRSGEFLPVELLDFSLKGIKIGNLSPLTVDSEIECSISIPKSLSKEIFFRARIKYGIRGESGGKYVMGAEIVQTHDNLWFDMFCKIHDFIKERMEYIF